MDKKSQEKLQEQQNLNKFNSITQKVTPENQNQTHNSRKEGYNPLTKRNRAVIKRLLFCRMQLFECYAHKYSIS